MSLIIIITGCNAVGKTTTSNYLRKYATLHKIPHENKIVADSHLLFEAMRLDDNAGGFHHTHDWCVKDSAGHTHNQDKPEFPFTITDNELPNKMRIHFFTRLTVLPKTSDIWFVEWAGGVNTNPLHDPKSAIDYSYATVKRMLQKGSLPNCWLERVFAVIHLRANSRVRFFLNERRAIPFFAHLEEIEKGTAFWKKDEKVLRFYGYDDFYEIESLFLDAGIPIYTIENDGGDSFYNNLEAIADTLFLPSIVTSANTSFMQGSSEFSQLRDAVKITTTEKLLDTAKTASSLEKEKASL
jgi:hypothetical protein